MENIYEYDKVFTYEHLLCSAKICKRGVNWKGSVQNYMRELHYNVYQTYKELADRKFKIRSACEFDISERGKKRHINSVHIRERVVQRCLCDYCLLPVLSKTFIYDNCASLKGKGTSFALNRLKSHMIKHYHEHGTAGYILRFDFSDYFGSIPHSVVMGMLRKYICDEEILGLVEMFMRVGHSDGRGLSLGNQVSQVAALLVASPIDHMIKDRNRIKFYVRYMDDGIIIHHDKAVLEHLLSEIEDAASGLGLKLNDKKTRITKFSDGFTFLKKKIRIDDNGHISMRILRQSVTRMRRKLKKLHEKLHKGELEIEDIKSAYISWRSYALKYDSYRTVQSMDELYNKLFKGEENCGHTNLKSRT